MVWYAHLLKNFPQFVVIHIIKGFGVVDKAEVDVFLGEGNGNPLQYSCLENPMDGGTWQAAGHGVAKSRTRLSDFTFTFTFMYWRRKWQLTPVFLPGETQGWGSLVGCCLWGRTQSDTTEATQQQQQQQQLFFWNSCLFDDLVDVSNLICGSSAFSKTSLNIWKLTVYILLKPGLENFEHYFSSM